MWKSNRCITQFDVPVCDLANYCFLPPLAETCRSSFLQPADYAANVVLHTCTVLWLTQLPASLPTQTQSNLISRLNSWWGRGVSHSKTQKTTKTRTAKHILFSVATSRKFRLPTWRLHTAKHFDSKPHQTPTDTDWLLRNSKWFSQPPLLREKQQGGKWKHPLL
jgi:hypothetical protein